MNTILDAYGEKLDGEPELKGWMRFYYHYILCYYGFEEDAYNEVTLSVTESIIKIGHLIISITSLVLAIFYIDSDNMHLRAWLIAQSTVQLCMFFILLVLANRNDFKRRWFYPPSTTKPGSIASLHKWTNIIYFSSLVLTVLIMVWGALPLFFLHSDLTAKIWWILTSFYSVSVIVLGLSIWFSIDILKSSY